MKQIRIIILTFLILAASADKAFCRDTTLFHDLTHRITAEFRPVYNMPTHGFYRGWNDYGKAIPMASSAHLKYSFSLNPGSRLGRLYPTAYQGIGAAVHTFYNHQITGTPVILYLFQGSRIADLGRHISLDYEWNLGASYGWKVNKVVGSRWNIYINVGLPFTWHISPTWDLSFGPEYTHFSNGDTKFPNGGANTVGLRLGLTGRINAPKKETAPGKALVGREPDMKDKTFSDRMFYDLCFYGAWRADRYTDDFHLVIVNKAFATGGIYFNPMYRFNRYFSAGASLDLMMDRSSGEACGMSVRGELTMPFFSINLGAGYNILRTDNDLAGFYTTYNLKAFVTDRVFLNIGYRLSSVMYSHNLMFGIGVRL